MAKRLLHTSLLLAVLGAGAVASGCSKGDQVLGSYGSFDASAPPDAPEFDVPDCKPTCSLDGRSVVDSCKGTVETKCGSKETCVDAKCVDACGLADATKASVGCDYWAVGMDIHPTLVGSCFVTLVTNTFGEPAHVAADFRKAAIDLSKHAAIPRGEGKDLTYELYDPAKGLLPGEVLIVFLHQGGGVPCPVPAARSTGGQVYGTGWADAFHVTSDVPVVAYQMLPYGGGSAAVTGATLLLPTSAWGKNYVATTAHPDGTPSMDIVAAEDDTTVEILPKVDIVGREGLVTAAKAGTVAKYTLNKGEVLQLTQEGDLTGSPVEANKKVAVFAGHPCMNVPKGVGYCDHGEQQIPPVSALGNLYVGAPHRTRVEADTRKRFRLVGVVNNTQLTWDPPGAGPETIALGETHEVLVSGPFTVKSQDASHPFELFAYMGSSDPIGGYGDPDFVRMVTPSQFLNDYVFLTDPTYPETNLVVVRGKNGGAFADVTLDCLGPITTWQKVGSGDFEIAYVDLITGNFEPNGKCNNGVHRMTSSAPFGVWVWGWGGPATTGGTCGPFPDRPQSFTCHVSYGYPAGESVRPINEVVVSPRPK